jgi:murein DD-endopeptidase MepM/ murein hydrolase activator NlpD
VLLAVVVLLLASLCFAVAVAAQEPTPEPPIYEVQPGDTLFTIAQRFGTTVEALVATNGIEDPSLINVGQKLVIPTAQPELVPAPEPAAHSRVHPVHPGETLPALAFRYGTTVWALREDNALHRLGLLLPGQELTIPDPVVVVTGTATFPVVTGSPAPVVQGETLAIEVEGQQGMEVEGWFLGQALHFSGEEGRYWALVGIDPLTPADSYPVALRATEVDSGDRLTFQQPMTVTEGEFSTYNVVVPADRTGLLAADVSEAERITVTAVFSGFSEQQLWRGTFGYPLAGELRITAPFGQRRSYNGGPVSSYHAGYDLGADKGTPIYAPMTGTVVLAEPLQVRGRAVILDHGRGVFTGFWHLSQIDVTVGQVVGKGQVVGLVGNSGLSTGPHLHWEMRVLGVAVDAFQWTRREFP